MTSTSVIELSSSRTSSVGIATPVRRAGTTCVSRVGFVGLSGFGGGFSQLVVAERRWIHPLGDLGTDVGALVEPLAVAYHAVRLSGAQPNHSALVFGAGPIGLVTTAALRASGVEQIIVVEPAGARKLKAPIAGADHVIDPRTSDVVSEVRELTKGRGADVSFECAGIDAVLKSAILRSEEHTSELQ